MWGGWDENGRFGEGKIVVMLEMDDWVNRVNEVVVCFVGKRFWVWVGLVGRVFVDRGCWEECVGRKLRFCCGCDSV